MSATRGYPKGFEDRMLVTQRATQRYRGLLPATQWIFISQTKRGGLGLMDYENGWGDGDVDAPGQFCMDEHGRVRLRGRISGGTVGTVAFTLPYGFRPAMPQSFVLSNAESGYANLEVAPNGEATVTGIT